MKDVLVSVFDAIRKEFPADRVVADPELNANFVRECRNRGLTQPEATLNRTLLNLRKCGALRRSPRSKRTHFPNEDEYRFAAEMAIRFLERRDGNTLDDIICDPTFAAEFDSIAESIAPGYSSLQYRWAALNLRKSKNLEPEILARVAPPIKVESFSVKEVDVDELPTEQGLYLFFAAKELLYVGESENLRTRLRKHLDHSDNKALARWMWEFGTNKLRLELQVLVADTSTKVRKALELELIRSRKPVFNVNR